MVLTAPAALRVLPHRDVDHRTLAKEMGRRWSRIPPYSNMHASASAHMMVQTCADLADRGGEGKWRLALQFHTTADSIATPSVEARHNSRVMEQSHQQRHKQYYWSWTINYDALAP